MNHLPPSHRILLPGGCSLIVWIIAFLPPVSSLPIAAIELCQAREEVIWDLLLFFTTNYFSHAATVPATPGAKLPETILWTLVALFLPFAGLGRSLAMLMRHVQFHNNNVEKAAAQGAIVVVARTRDWLPDVGYEQEVFMQPPREFYTTYPEFSPATFDVRDYQPDIDGSKYRQHSVIDVKHYSLHGEFELPTGYSLAVVTLPFLSEIMKSCLKPPGNIMLSMHQSWLKRCVSIAQLISASYSIYRSRGDQLHRFGYAAYALTVFPYAIMSLVNLIADAILGEYPTVYVLQTPILLEATGYGKHRPGAIYQSSLSVFARIKNGLHTMLEWLHLRARRERPKNYQGIFDGAVGRLKNQNPVVTTGSAVMHSLTPMMTNRTVATDSAASVSTRSDAVLAHVCIERAEDTKGTSCVFKVRIGGQTRRFTYIHPDDPSAQGIPRFVIGSAINSEDEARVDGHDESTANKRMHTMKESSRRRRMRLAAHKSAKVFKAVLQQWVLLYIVSFVVVLLAPYMLIWALTHFDPRSSTRPERAWTIAWLCASQISFLVSLIYFFTHPSETRPASTFWKPSYFVICAFLSIASIGGMVEVGKMYLLDQGFWDACDID